MVKRSLAELVQSLKQCRNLCQGRQIHAELTCLGHSQIPYVENLLIQMYGQCASLDDAWAVFQRMSERANIYSWNLITSAYVKHCHPDAAKRLFDNMAVRDVVSWNAVLTAFTQAGKLSDAQDVLALMPERNVVSWNLMLSAFAQRGHADSAKDVFVSMKTRDVLTWTSMIQSLTRSSSDFESVFNKAPCWDVVCWNAVISAYGNKGDMENVMQTFISMPERNAVSWNALLHASGGNHHDESSKTTSILQRMPCWSSRTWNFMIHCGASVDETRLVFQRAPQRDEFTWNTWIGFLSRFELAADEACLTFHRMPRWDVFSCNAVLSALSNVGLVEEAKSKFDTVVPVRDMVSWNTMVHAFSQAGNAELASLCFQRMPQHDLVSWNSLVQAYACHGQVEAALEVLKRIPCFSLVASNSLIQAYSQQGRVDVARQMLETMPQKDEVSWNSVISGYARKRTVGEAKLTFDQMPQKSVVSWNALLQAFVECGLAEAGTDLFSKMPRTSAWSWNSLIQAYGVRGEVVTAKQIFNLMPEKDVVAWNGIMSAHMLSKKHQDAVRVLVLMDLDGTQANAVSYLTVLDACALLTDVAAGSMVHSELKGIGLELDNRISTALLNMYSKSSHVDQALSIFNKMPVKCLVSSTAMVAAFAENGLIASAADQFSRMQLLGFLPDNVSFVNILSSCSHVGRVDAGLSYFICMVANYGIQPGFDHYACMVDLLARAGELEIVIDLIKSMPFHLDPVTSSTFLSACRSQDLDDDNMFGLLSNIGLTAA